MSTPPPYIPDAPRTSTDGSAAAGDLQSGKQRSYENNVASAGVLQIPPVPPPSLLLPPPMQTVATGVPPMNFDDPSPCLEGATPDGISRMVWPGAHLSFTSNSDANDERDFAVPTAPVSSRTSTDATMFGILQSAMHLS